MQKRVLSIALALLMVLSVLPLCGAEESAASEYDGVLVEIGEMPLDYAENFSITLYEGGYRMISIPSRETRFLVVPEGMSVPAELDEDVVVLQQPLNQVYVDSTGVVSLIAAMGGLEHVKLVATDVDKWYIDSVKEAMTNGSIAYSGNYKEPDYEMMASNNIQLQIGTTMLDSYPEVLEKFEELGIPTMVEVSSRESHPLGRVEWVKVMGVLFGMEDEANAFFEEQKAKLEYISAESTGKTVAMGYITSTDKCYARNGGDYMAKMIALAGGEYILSDMNPEESGSTSMTFEDFYAMNKDAEYLFYVNFARSFSSIQDMIDYNPLFADFKAVQEGHVYITSPDFTQTTADIASIVTDMNTILSSEDADITTDHLIKIS